MVEQPGEQLPQISRRLRTRPAHRAYGGWHRGGGLPVAHRRRRHARGAGPAAQPHAAPVEARYGDHRFLPQQGHRRRPREIFQEAGFSEGGDPLLFRRLFPLQTGRRQMRAAEFRQSLQNRQPGPARELPQTAAQYARGGPVLAPRQRPAADDLRDPRLHGRPLLAQPPVLRAALVLRPGLRHPAVHPAPPRQTPVAPVAVQRPRPVCRRPVTPE